VRPGGSVAAAPEPGAGPPARLGQRLRRLGPRPHRHRAAARPARQLPAAHRSAGVRGGRDHLAALRRRVLTGARLRLPSLSPFGRPADHRRLGLAVDRPGQLRPRQLDRPGRRGPAAPLGRHRPASRSPDRALLARLPAGEAVPLFVFDGGYDSAQLTLDLAEQRATVLVRLRADRCFYADPPPAARSPKGGRPRRHGAKFAFADPRPAGRPRPPPWSARTTSTPP
jgi:hypothetical protein